jgi:hypothetical protein
MQTGNKQTSAGASEINGCSGSLITDFIKKERWKP